MDEKSLDNGGNDPCLVVSTASSREEASLLARTLVEEELAACCTIIPGALSVFRWEGDVQEAVEQVLLIKTTISVFPALEQRIRALHSYHVPEILALNIGRISDPYLQWLASCVSHPEARGASKPAQSTQDQN